PRLGGGGAGGECGARRGAPAARDAGPDVSRRRGRLRRRGARPGAQEGPLSLRAARGLSARAGHRPRRACRVRAALAGGDRASDRVAPARGGGGRLAPRARRAEPDGRAPRVTRREASHIATGRVYALALLITLSARVAAEPPAALGPCGPVDRPYDPVELPAARFRDLKGTAVGRLGLVALRQGRVRPIPFQVDQRNGRKLALPEGPQPTRAERAAELLRAVLRRRRRPEPARRPPAPRRRDAAGETRPLDTRRAARGTRADRVEGRPGPRRPPLPPSGTGRRYPPDRRAGAQLL